ncbi:hypothetical protein FBEOM_5167 [Fusarium beomiforme]|uniref:Uncharacterized protein n=1 Tax=Fusarium beomiforme TaxID=44412 RepID=A0A9P5ALF5_9HYPO|nr:hypothetical protein FBEOM_5167 [Fusarium beomiforme]
MAQLSPAERLALEGKALLSLSASTSRALFTMDPQCPLALQLRKTQTEIRRHILARLEEEESDVTEEMDQDNDRSATEPQVSHLAYVKNASHHPDTAIHSIEQDSDSESVRLALSPVRVAEDTLDGARCAKVCLPLRPVAAISIYSTRVPEEQQTSSITMNESNTPPDQRKTSKKRGSSDEGEPVTKRHKTWINRLTSSLLG